MESLTGVYEGRIVSLGDGNATAFVPQVFGDIAITISDFMAQPLVGMGWVSFQSGDPEFPVWLTGPAGGGIGGGGGSGFTYVQDTRPHARAQGETWWNSNVAGSGTSWVAIDEGTGELVWVQFAPGSGGGGSGGFGSDGYTYMQDTLPPIADASDGQTWFNTATGNSYVFYEDVDGGQWVQDGPASGSAGPAGPAGADGAPGAAGPPGPAGPGSVVTVVGTSQQITVSGTAADRVISLPTSTLSIPSSSVQCQNNLYIGTGNGASEQSVLYMKVGNTAQNVTVQVTSDGTYQITDKNSRPFIGKDLNGVLRFWVNGVECLALDGNYTWISKPIQGGRFVRADQTEMTFEDLATRLEEALARIAVLEAGA